MKKFFYTLFISSSLMASNITTTTMLDNTYYCVESKADGNILVDFTLIKNGDVHLKPIMKAGSTFEYQIDGNLILITDPDSDGEALKLSNATEDSFDLLYSEDGFTTEILLWSCHDNIDDMYTEADAIFPTVVDSAITLDGIATALEWDGMVELDATETLGDPIDITTMKLAKDSDYIYILVQTDKDISTFLPGTDDNGWIHTLWLGLNEIEIGTQNGAFTQWRQAWPDGVPNGIPDAWNELAGKAELVINGNTIEAKYPRSLLQNQEYIAVSAAFGADNQSHTQEDEDDYNIDGIENAAWIGDIQKIADGSTPDISLPLNTDNLSGLALFCTGDLFLHTFKFIQRGDSYINSFNGDWLETTNFFLNDIDTFTLFGDFEIDLTEISSSSVSFNNVAEDFSSICYRTFKESLDYENRYTDLIPFGTMAINGTIDGWDNTLEITADTTIGNPIDITKINVSKDEDNLYLMFQTDSSISDYFNANSSNILWISLNDRFEFGKHKDGEWFEYNAGDHKFSILPQEMDINNTISNTVFQVSIPRNLVGSYLSLKVELGEYVGGDDGSNPSDVEYINFRLEETKTQSVFPAIIMYLLN